MIDEERVSSLRVVLPLGRWSCVVRKLAEQAMKSKAMSSNPLWLLLQRLHLFPLMMDYNP